MLEIVILFALAFVVVATNYVINKRIIERIIKLEKSVHEFISNNDDYESVQDKELTSLTPVPKHKHHLILIKGGQ